MVVRPALSLPPLHAINEGKKEFVTNLFVGLFTPPVTTTKNDPNHLACAVPTTAWGARLTVSTQPLSASSQAHGAQSMEGW